MTRNDYRHHSAWNDRNEAKMRWMTSEWWNETVAQTAKFSSHSTHFDVIRLILASSNSSVQWGWLINDPKMRSLSGPKLTTFPKKWALSTEEGVISVWAWLFNSLLGEFSFPRNLTSVPITSRNQRSKSDFVCRQSVSDYVTITNTALPAETSFSDNGGLWNIFFWKVFKWVQELLIFLPIIFLSSRVFSNNSSVG